MKKIKYVLWGAIFTLFSCGGGDSSETSNNNIGETEQNTFLRANNPSIPSSFAGNIKNNTRYYSVEANGYKVAINPSGLIGSVSLVMGDELLSIKENTQTNFATTMVAGTNIVVDIAKQPFLQNCVFESAINSGVISSTETLQLFIICSDNYSPSAPYISRL